MDRFTLCKKYRARVSYDMYLHVRSQQIQTMVSIFTVTDYKLDYQHTVVMEPMRFLFNSSTEIAATFVSSILVILVFKRGTLCELQIFVINIDKTSFKILV